jgi:hypothetical protein
MQSLRLIAERYHLQIRSGRIWTPYWINSPEPPFRLNAPYRGKATAGQLEAAVKRALTKEGHVNDTDAAIRNYMKAHGLGVDCSGFVYHVLDQWLQGRGLRLAQFLQIDRQEIEERNRRRPEYARRWGTRPIPSSMPLLGASKIWGSDPVYRTGVRRLLDPRVVSEIILAHEIRPGDMIGMTNARDEDHIGLVLEITPAVITYADSAYETGDGVGIREIEVGQTGHGLGDQRWSQSHIFNPGVSGRVDGVWRLKALL